MGGFGLQFPQLDFALAQFEGYNTYGSLAQSNYNPGNIQYGQFAYNHGAIGSNNGFAVFPDALTGFQATDSLVGSYANRGYTLEQLVNAWSPPASGNLNNKNYVDYLSRQTGLPPSSQISTIRDPFSLGGLGGLLGNGILNGLGSVTGLPIGGSSTGGIFGSAADALGVSWGRIATFMVGMILITAGLFMFKPVNEIVVQPAVKATKAAVVDAATAA